MSHMRHWVSTGWGTNIGITIENPRPTLATLYTDGKGFLELRRHDVAWPVNQFYDLNPYKAHAARFAHELDAVMGHHTLASAEEADRLTVHQTLSAIIGSAARRYAEWEAIDPEQLIVGGTYDGTPLWQHHDRTVQDYEDIDAALCGQCDIDIFAREFYFEAGLPAFRSAWRQGIIYSADRSTTPWSPTLFDVPPAGVSTSEFHDELDVYFHKMLRHYAQVVAAQDRESRINGPLGMARTTPHGGRIPSPIHRKRSGLLSDAEPRVGVRQQLDAHSRDRPQLRRRRPGTWMVVLLFPFPRTKDGQPAPVRTMG